MCASAISLKRFDHATRRTTHMDDSNLLDELRIVRVLSRYCRNLDDERFDALPTLFAADAVFETMGKRLEGRAAIREFFPRDSGGGGHRPTGTHLLSNPVIDIDGDQADAESDWAMVRRDAQGVCTIVLAGRYRDRFVRTDGEWLIEHRKADALARNPADQG
jgi:3-phenylpropionate/cinnamic acid dioxygenase small subunit